MDKSLVLGLDKDQKRKEKPEMISRLALLDVIANGTSVRLFRETVVSFEKDPFTRYVMCVRRRRGKGWMSLQRMWPEKQSQQALLEVNRVAKQEINRASEMLNF
ncbi:TPA: hypothetical protein RMT52_005128 [Escherichia coli]|nr:hypothetical protein [Escherichia coli]HAX1982188.1 hypothetical protein [Escherichia coli]HAX2346759.1 hypothetical protein [Escherichia coli]HBN7237035.1 hypothetical protein [Escherichia coli]HBN7443570.1 hypothetical protein [Escherichia coli]